MVHRPSVPSNDRGTEGCEVALPGDMSLVRTGWCGPGLACATVTRQHEAAVVDRLGRRWYVKGIRASIRPMGTQ